MKGTEVIELFEKHGHGAHAIVAAVYNGLYPDYFGVRLKPFNFLTCEYAEPERRPPHDPGACKRHADRQAVAGISYCPHTPGGEPNAMVEDDGVEGTCKYGYAALRDIEFFERLKGCEFVRAEVEEYLDDLFPGRHRTPIQPRPIAAVIPCPATDPEAIGPEQGTQVEAVPHFATASDLLDYHRGRGVHELHGLARLVDEEFTGTARSTDEALGRLLPANPGAEITAEGHKRQGHRLRKAYQ